MKLKHLFSFFIFFLSIQLFAQTDSLKKPVIVNRDSIIRSFFKETKEEKFTKTDFTQRTERALDILDESKTMGTLTWKELMIQEQIKDSRKILRVLRNVFRRHTNSDFRNLELYKNILVEIQNRNEKFKEILGEKRGEIKQARINIREIPKDTVIREMIIQNAIDTAAKGKRRVKNLKKKWALTDGYLKMNLDSVDRWSSQVSMQAITTADLLQRADSITQQSSFRALKGDYPFIWEKDTFVAVQDTSAEVRNSTVATEHRKIIGYYIKKNLSTILWLPLLVIVFFTWWTHRNYKRYKNASDELKGENNYLTFINKNKIISALIIGLSLFPLFDVHAPWFYLLINQCVIIASVIYLFFQKGRKPFLPVFIFILCLLFAITIDNAIEPGIFQRLSLIALNIISIVSAFFLLPRIQYLPHIKKTVRVITYAYIVLNIIAIIANVLGRVIIAEGLTNAGVIGITQVITLSVFIQIILEALYLQLAASRFKRGVKLTADYEVVLQELNKPVFFFCMVIWLMMFSANLYMYEMIKSGVVKIFTSDINIGSLSFTIGNVVLFFLIIWIAHLMQKFIGAFFGDAEGDEDLDNKKERSRMMVVKLVVLCLGYLMAVAVSGLPVDKITIIIGALGVGVGMGLQSIVNNFVSGVVLIFDRPLQIGDMIEVGENKGKVKNIGIRASTLLTDDGAEVIIPNGDILSRPITNWTLTTNQRRIDLDFTLQTSEDKLVISQIIKDTLREADEVVAEKDPVILWKDVKENEIKIVVYFWCSNALKADWVRSEVRYLLFGKFREKKIPVL